MEFLHTLILLLAVLSETYSLSSLKEIMGRSGGSVWIPCYYNVKYRNSVKSFYQKRAFGRHNILAQTEPISTAGSDDRMTISDDKSQGIFTIKMKSLRKSDEGYYFCGLKWEKQNKESYMYLHVDEGLLDTGVSNYISGGLRSLLVFVHYFLLISSPSTPWKQGDYGLSFNSDSNVFTGQENGSVAVSCKYTNTKYVSFKKYWCRGRYFDSCQKIKISDSPRHYNTGVSIRDDTASQEFTVTMTGLQRKDSDWYWCAIEKAFKHERVPVHIRVTQASETEQLQVDTSSSPQSVVTNGVTVSRNQRVYISTEPPETYSNASEDSRSHLTIALVMSCLVLLFLSGSIFTLKTKRNMREGNQNEKRTMHQQGEGTTEVKSDIYAVVSHQKKRNKNKVTEPPSEDIHYAVISFQRKTEDRKPYRDPEDSVTYSAVGLKGTADTY